MSHYGPSRELVVDVCRTLLERGYLKATEGNVSVRVPGEDAYAITPSSYDYGKMEPGDICVWGSTGGTSSAPGRRRSSRRCTRPCTSAATTRA